MKKYLICFSDKEFFMWADEFYWRGSFMTEGLVLKRNGNIVAYFERVDCWMQIYDSENQDDGI